MHQIFEQFNLFLEQSDKEGCIRTAVEALRENRTDVVTLYTEVLAPALTQTFCRSTQKTICIWEEHVRTSIVRSVIENCYPYVIQERDHRYRSPQRGKVIVVCPTEELHEIGARMATDFFTLCGYSVTFIGANTPQDEIVSAIEYLKPRYVAISITNYYNLVAARYAVQRISAQKGALNFKVLLGGQACLYHAETCLEMGADQVINTFAEICQLGGPSDAAV